LFTLYPESLAAFHDFKGLPIQEVAVHKKLRGHALSVMYSIKSFIDTLDDLETLDELVRKNARNHAPRGVGEKQFMVSIGYLFLLCLYFCDLSIYPSCVCIFVIEYLFLMSLYFCNLSIYHSCVCIFVIEFLSLMCLYFCD
jgi:hypothetical protein